MAFSMPCLIEYTPFQAVIFGATAASGLTNSNFTDQLQVNLPFVEGKLRVELAGLRVTQGVCQDFLSDAQQILFPVQREFPRLASHNEFRPYRVARSQLLDRAPESFAQVLLLQGLRAKRPHGTPRLSQALAGQLAALLLS